MSLHFRSPDLKRSRRYDISHLVEAQFEPGSRGRVLRNLLRIKNKREMDQVEAREHLRALEQLIGIYDKNHRFNAPDICKIHGIWLGNIYAWTGHYRQINLSKGEFPFAAAKQIPRLMTNLEKGPLRKFTPCRFPSMDELVKAICRPCRIIVDSPFSRWKWQSDAYVSNFDGLAG